jgi:DNA helicase-2/ATP-dependent DNA helicase PcrA
MLIEGPLKSGKTDSLVKKFTELIKSGVSSSEILFLCENSYKKNFLTGKIKDELANQDIHGLGNIPVYTFNGIVYNSINNNWPIIENILYSENSDTVIMPYLTGLDTTQFLIKSIIKSDDFSDYFSKNNLLHQLFRRYKLITENQLDLKEIEEKSVLLNETFSDSAAKAFKELRTKTNNYRSFDYLKQINTFIYLLNSEKIKDFSNINYFFADDIDEYSYSAIIFTKYMINKSKNVFLSSDPEGTARRGFLCGYTSGWKEIKNIVQENPTILKSKSPFYSNAMKVFENIKGQSPFENFKSWSSEQDANTQSGIAVSNEEKRAEMLDKACLKLKELVDEGANPSDIVIIAPIIDESVKFNLKEFFTENNLQYQFLSGSKNLYDNLLVYSSIIILELINRDWGITPSVFEIRILLNGLLNIPINLCREVLDSYEKTGKLSPNVVFGENNSDITYQNLVATIKNLSDPNYNAYDQMIEIVSKVITPVINEHSELEPLNMTIKSLNEFTILFSKNNGNFLYPKDWINQIKNKITSDNPSLAFEIKENSIVIATPQKAVDFEIASKYQIWFDISSQEWTKDDVGTLYNAWVFQKNSAIAEYTPEIHNKLTLEKTAHLLRKLIILANKQIFGFSSVLDSTGNENTGILPQFIIPAQKPIVAFKKIIPREDQKPVLQYKEGKLAVPAVPGAGKTTIMLALIVELISRGVSPSKILVLTYMEAATKNFLEKIKKFTSYRSEMPAVMTIHGLAYKIIQDEDNFTKLNLSEDFLICDDIQKLAIMNSLCLKYPSSNEEESLEEWLKINITAVSKTKTSQIPYSRIEKIAKESEDEELMIFTNIYKEYEQALKENDMIDYDDLLILAVRLLENFPSVQDYYQNKFSFVIEDEAQDSSAIQQKLINIISEKSQNLIRCGDVNQAIMTTFTNADVEGFIEFIKKNKRVEMTSSQRCSKDIYELANYLVEYAGQNPELKEAFYPMKMIPAENQNPISENALNFNILNTQDDERNWVLNEIQKNYEENPDQTFAILLKTNALVFEWARLIEKQGFKVISRTDSIKQKKVFKFILKLLEVIEYPWNNKRLVELMELYNEFKIVKISETTIEYIKNSLKTPFINELENSDETSQFLWDVHYWLENSDVPPEELVIKIGNYYFNDTLDKSNVNLFSVLIKRYVNRAGIAEDSHSSINLPEIVTHFKTLMKQDKLYGVRIFNEEDSKDTSLNGFIQVMTLHKSKGDEFDTVFIPEMSDFAFPTDLKKYTARKSKKTLNLKRKIDNIINKRKILPEEEAKKEVNETLRLIYVGITRAKSKLYMSAAEKIKNKYNKIITSDTSELLKHFNELFKSLDN